MAALISGSLTDLSHLKASVGGGISSSLTHVAGDRPQFLNGCWTSGPQFLTALLTKGFPVFFVKRATLREFTTRQESVGKMVALVF